MLNRWFKIVLIIGFLFTTSIFADEIIPDFSEESIPILNNELTLLRNAINSVVFSVNNPQYNPSLMGWNHDLTFSSTDNDTVAWTSGTITFSDSSSTSYSISSGNTGDMTTFTFIYLDLAISETALQTTTTASNTIGENKLLIGVAENVADATKYATYQIFGGSGGIGGTFVIAADNIATNVITANEINVGQLSAISADLGTVTAGIVTGATIRTAASGSRFYMDTDDIIAYDDSDNEIFHIELTDTDVGDVVIGDYASDTGAKWDDSAGTFDIKGTITATTGAIGGWDIGATTLESANDKIILDDANEKITVGDTGSTYINIDGANTRILTSDFVSGALGSGWSINDDTAEFNNIRARGKISTSVFEKDVISVVGGNVLVMDGDILDTDMTALETSTMTISGDTTFATNDTLRMKDGVDDEWFTITDYSTSPYDYTVTRDAGGDYSYDTYTKLCSHFDGADAATAYTDPVAGAYTFVGTAQLDTAQKVFGTASLLLDGDSDYVTLLDSADWNFGTGNFTIDFRTRFASLPNVHMCFASQYVDATHYWYLWKYRTSEGNKLDLTFIDGTSKGSYQMTNAWAGCAIDTNYHIEVCRNGTTCLMFIDGVSQTLTETVAFGTNDVGDLASVLTMGRDARTTTYYVNGWIDEYRISKGIARHTANFTAPTIAYSKVLPAWKAGTAVVNYGASGEGGIYLTSSESNAPYLSVVTHAGAPYTTLNTRLRLGNLNGSYGVVADSYGIGIGDYDSDVYLKYDTLANILVVADLESPDYVANTSGFKLDATAGLELNEGTIQGTDLIESLVIYAIMFSSDD